MKIEKPSSPFTKPVTAAKYNTSIRGDNVIINTRLCAGPDRNLNPILLFDTILRLIDMDYEWKSISRISLLTKDFKEYK